MKYRIITKVGIKFLIILNFLSLIFSQTKISSEFKNEKEELINQQYIKNLPSYDNYILGSGDVISIQIFSGELQALSEIFTIDGEGTTKLPRLKKIYVNGLSIGELTKLLTVEYQNYIINPEVVLEIVSYRPITVYIDGEINTPGKYTLTGKSGLEKNIEDLNLKEGKPNQETNNIIFPTVFDLIRKSQGVTVYADLSKVKVSRINKLSSGGGRIDKEINLLKTLNLEDISQNIRIYDGDTLFVPKGEKPAISQIAKAIKSNLNPKFIEVFVQGRVNNGGLIKVTRSSTLLDAIAVSGGTKVLKGPVTFLRYLNDGSYDRRKFRIKSSAKRGSYKNPYLVNGDLIYVGKGAFNSSSEVISDITAPFSGIVNTLGLYKVLFD